MELRAVDDEICRMGDGTYMWVQVVHFELPPQLDDHQALAALVRSPGYAWDAASPYPEGLSPQATTPVHGRWTLDAVTPDAFTPTTAAHAEAVLRQWATEQDWTEPDYTPPAAAMERLAEVITLLHRGPVHHLQNPSDDHLHDYGWVTGGDGFHEFVVIDRAHATLHLLIASDD